MDSELHDAQVDYLLELYCTWRTECAAVRTAYERFAAAKPSERPAAFSDYEAALDREEAAADIYAEQIGVVSAGLAGKADRRHTRRTRSSHAGAATASAWPWRW